MGKLIDVSNIRVKPQYMQDVMGIAMIRCEDLSRILADVPTVEAIPKTDYENRLKADMVAMLEEIQSQIDDLWEATWNSDYRGGFKDGCLESNNLIQQKISSLKEGADGENND